MTANVMTASELAPQRRPNRLSRRALWALSITLPTLLAPIWTAMMGSLPAGLGTASGLVLLLLLAVATVTDLSARKVYNWATYSALGWALALNATDSAFRGRFTDSLGTSSLLQSAMGAMVCFVIMLMIYTLARGGAGDAKLMTAVGALIGYEQGVLAIGISYILAGAAVLIWSIWSQGPFAMAVALGRLFGSMLLPRWIHRPTDTDTVLLKKPVPLAGFFALGTLAVVLGSG